MSFGENLLSPAQLDAIDEMHNGCILCGDVGSGKSRTALAYYYKENGGDLYAESYEPMDDPPRDLYIITTAHKRDLKEWEGEMIPFLIGEHAGIYANKVVVDSWNNIQKYKNVVGAFFIFDEQRVVGRGKWAKTFVRIARRNKWILLSATPGDTWMDYIPVFMANNFYMTRSDFIQEHVTYKPFQKFPVVDHNRYRNQGKLIRYRRQILVDINEAKHTTQHHEDVFVNYDIPKYKDISRKRWNPWSEEPIENSSEYCQCLRKIVNTSDSRQVAVLEIFEQHPKVIIFYNYDYELELLKELFVNKYQGVKVAEWNGHKHEPVPDGGSWVYLVQYAAGAEGWNCITTDTIIFYSLNYSYKTMKQASGRIDRRNTPFTDLYYYHIRSRSGIDLAINRCLVEKKQFNEKRFAEKTTTVRWALPIVKEVKV